MKTNDETKAHGARARRGLIQEDHHRATTTTAESLYEADWWVEHLEEEIEPNFAEDLELLLKNSKEDENILASLKRTRDAVKASDDVAMPESGFYYQDLHNRIMAAIDFEEIPQSRREAYMTSIVPKNRRVRGFAWQGVFGAMGLTMMLALMTWMGMRESLPQAPLANEESRAVADVESPASEETLERGIAAISSSYSNEVNGFETEQEIVEEAAIAKLSQLSKEQVDELYRSLRE